VLGHATVSNGFSENPLKRLRRIPGLSFVTSLKRGANENVLRLGAASDRITAKFHMTERQYKSFAEFWPYYVSEHSKPATRALHAIGSTIALVLMVILIALGKWWLFPLGLVVGYGCAWIGHFFVEKNRPATFKYPLWSFMGDWKMLAFMIAGRMEKEIQRLASQSSATNN